MTVFFPQGITQVAEGLVSISRLNKFLLYEEARLTLPAARRKESSQGRPTTNGLGEKSGGSAGEYSVKIENATARWTEGMSDNTFTNVNLHAKRGSLIAIIGPVGSGKTSLMHAILKELPLVDGSIEVNGEIGYASQEPWLFAGSVRGNILFGQELDRQRYKRVEHFTLHFSPPLTNSSIIFYTGYQKVCVRKGLYAFPVRRQDDRGRKRSFTQRRAKG